MGSENDFDDLRILAGLFQKQQDTRRKNALEYVKERWALGEPLSNEEIVSTLFHVHDFQKELHNHPNFPLLEKIGEIERAFKTLQLAWRDLVSSFGQYYSTIRLVGFDEAGRSKEEVEAYVNFFLSSAMTLVAAYRGLYGMDPRFKQQLTQLRQICFRDTRESRFVQDLRNLCQHESIVSFSMSGKVSHGEEISANAELKLDSSDLLVFSQWSKESRQYISERQQLDLIEILRRYFDGCKMLWQRYQSVTGLFHHPGLTELRRISVVRKTFSNRMYFSMVLQNAKEGVTDPFDHIRTIFPEHVIKVALAMEPGSTEQFEYFRTYLDPLGVLEAATSDQVTSLIDGAPSLLEAERFKR